MLHKFTLTLLASDITMRGDIAIYIDRQVNSVTLIQAYKRFKSNCND